MKVGRGQSSAATRTARSTPAASARRSGPASIDVPPSSAVVWCAAGRRAPSACASASASAVSERVPLRIRWAAPAGRRRRSLHRASAGANADSALPISLRRARRRSPRPERARGHRPPRGGSARVAEEDRAEAAARRPHRRELDVADRDHDLRARWPRWPPRDASRSTTATPAGARGRNPRHRLGDRAPDRPPPARGPAESPRRSSGSDRELRGRVPLRRRAGDHVDVDPLRRRARPRPRRRPGWRPPAVRSRRDRGAGSRAPAAPASEEDAPDPIGQRTGGIGRLEIGRAGEGGTDARGQAGSERRCPRRRPGRAPAAARPARPPPAKRRRGWPPAPAPPAPPPRRAAPCRRPRARAAPPPAPSMSRSLITMA